MNIWRVFRKHRAFSVVREDASAAVWCSGVADMARG